jgi:Mycoplasma protein of unknown function, DUF285
MAPHTSRRQISISRLPLLLVLALSFLPNHAEARLRGVFGPAETARQERERRKAELCAPPNQELCGDGQGILVCEYDENSRNFATRCVKKNSFAKHVGLHLKNYCGSCRKSFQNVDELKSAIQKYIANSTEHTNVARVYGWPIGLWHVENVADFSHLFSGQQHFNEDIGGWDVSRVSSMQAMFLDAFEFDQDLSEWNVESVTDMSLMFDRAYAFQGQGLASWDTSNVRSFQRMFRIAKNFQEDIGAWDVFQATDLSLMFYRAEAFNQPLGDWDVHHVSDFSYMFAFAKSFDKSLANWKTLSATSMRGMFQSADSFAQDLSEWSLSKVTDTSFMFSNAIAFDKAIDANALLDAWDMKKVEYQDQMFGVIAPVFNNTSNVLTSIRHASSANY